MIVSRIVRNLVDNTGQGSSDGGRDAGEGQHQSEGVGQVLQTQQFDEQDGTQRSNARCLETHQIRHSDQTAFIIGPNILIQQA